MGATGPGDATSVDPGSDDVATPVEVLRTSSVNIHSRSSDGQIWPTKKIHVCALKSNAPGRKPSTVCPLGLPHDSAGHCNTRVSSLEFVLSDVATSSRADRGSAAAFALMLVARPPHSQRGPPQAPSGHHKRDKPHRATTGSLAPEEGRDSPAREDNSTLRTIAPAFPHRSQGPLRR